jgi:hypothetical protein
LRVVFAVSNPVNDEDAAVFYGIFYVVNNNYFRSNFYLQHFTVEMVSCKLTLTKTVDAASHEAVGSNFVFNGPEPLAPAVRHRT